MPTDLAPAIAEPNDAPASRLASTLYRLTVEQYLKMIDAGIFDQGPRAELLGGFIVEKMTKHTPHNFGVMSLGEALRTALAPGWCVREEKSIVLDAWSRPEPDITVARGPRTAYRHADPTPEEIAILFEVADSSYDADRFEKWPRYAAARTPAYGILNIQDRRMELYGDPEGEGQTAAYRTGRTYSEDTEFPVLIDGHEVGRIAVADLLS